MLPSYNIIYGPNSSIVVEIALPGYSAKDLEVTFEKDILTISEVKVPKPKADYLRRGIISNLPAKYYFDPNTKIDDCSLKNGIMTILASQKMPENGSYRITIN